MPQGPFLLITAIAAVSAPIQKSARHNGLSSKGQIISKCLFGVFNFFQKTNKNTSHTSKTELIHSFLEELTA